MKDLLILLLKIALLAFAIALKYVWYDLVDIRLPFLRNVYSSTLGMSIILLFLNISYTGVKWLYQRQQKDPRGGKPDNVIVGLRNIFIIFSAISVFVSIFGFFGIDVKTLFTTLSIVAAAIAVVTKDFIIDLIVGIYMGFSKDYEIGDYVRIGVVRGKLIEIGLFKVKILNDDDDVVFFSNAKVYSSEVVNYTQRDIRLMSVDFEIDIQRIRSIEGLEQDLVHSLAGFREYIEPNSYALKIVDVKKDSLDLKFQYRLRELDQDMHKSIRRKTVRQVFSSITRREDEHQGAAQ
jgi:small-conductance mechanosensitive channel